MPIGNSQINMNGIFEIGNLNSESISVEDFITFSFSHIFIIYLVNKIHQAFDLML